MVEDKKDWRETAVENIFPDHIAPVLANAGIDTLGQLADFINEERFYTDIRGVSVEMSKKIQDCLGEFWQGYLDSMPDVPA